MDAPILEAIPRSDGYGLKVYCAYCRKWHYHGHTDGHRVAHCDDNGKNGKSPYLKTGYVLETRSKK